jgi:hypothetical protein
LVLAPAVSAGLLIPIGPFSDLVSLGFQTSALFFFRNLGINNLDIGLNVQFQVLPGPLGSAADWFINVPVLIRGGYSFFIGKSFFVQPHISTGVTASILRYDPDGFVIGVEDPEYQNTGALYFQIGGGVVLGFNWKRWTAELNVQYEVIFGPSQPIMVIPIWLDVGFGL